MVEASDKNFNKSLNDEAISEAPSGRSKRTGDFTLEEMSDEMGFEYEEGEHEPSLTDIEDQSHLSFALEADEFEDTASGIFFMAEAPIEIPDLYEDMLSLTELDDFTVKRKAKSILLELDLEKALEEDLGEEEEEVTTADKSKVKSDVELPVYSDEELLLFLTKDEEKDQVKVVRVVVEEKKDQTGVTDFLINLIEEVIRKHELVDLEDILRHKLDRNKLIRAFKLGVHEMIEETRKRFWYHKKIVDFFHKKNNRRAVEEDKPEVLNDTINRYKKTLINLDKAKARSNASQMQINSKLTELRKSNRILIANSNAKIQAFNDRLKEVGLTTVSINTGQPMSEKAIDTFVKKMNNTRNQIADLRLTLIKTQHRLSTLLNEDKKLEDIGEGLKMVNYEALKAETQSLEDKVEEKNMELIKFRQRCAIDTHLLAHLREKQVMVNQLIAQKEEILLELENELTLQRSYLNNLKFERDNTRKKRNEMSYSCGLLDKPYLLHDYDATIEKIRQTENRVDELKQNKEHMLNQLDKIMESLEKF